MSRQTDRQTDERPGGVFSSGYLTQRLGHQHRLTGRGGAATLYARLGRSQAN